MPNPLAQGLPRSYSAADRWLLENPKFLEQMQNAGASPYNRMGGGFAVAEEGSLPSLTQGLGQMAGAGARTAAPIAAGMMIPTDTGMDPAEGIHQKIDAQSRVLGGPQISNEEMQQIVAQAAGGPSKAPPTELYNAMDQGAGGMPMMQKASYRPANAMGPAPGISPQDAQAAVDEAMKVSITGGGLPDANYSVKGAKNMEEAERAAGGADYHDRGKKKKILYKGKKTRRYSED